VLINVEPLPLDVGRDPQTYQPLTIAPIIALPTTASRIVTEELARAVMLRSQWSL